MSYLSERVFDSYDFLVARWEAKKKKEILIFIQ